MIHFAREAQYPDAGHQQQGFTVVLQSVQAIKDLSFEVWCKWMMHHIGKLSQISGTNDWHTGRGKKTSCFIVLALDDSPWVGSHVWQGLLLWTKFPPKKTKCNQNVTLWRSNSNFTAPFSCFEPQWAWSVTTAHNPRISLCFENGNALLLLDDVDSFWQLLLNHFESNFYNVYNYLNHIHYILLLLLISENLRLLFLAPWEGFPRQLSSCLELLKLGIVLSTAKRWTVKKAWKKSGWISEITS